MIVLMAVPPELFRWFPSTMTGGFKHSLSQGRRLLAMSLVVDTSYAMTRRLKTIDKRSA